VRTFAEAAAEVASKTSEVGESSFVPGEVEEDEVVPDGYPLCPCCGASMDIAEYKEVKQTVARKFGKPIQTLLFPEED
jgi:ribonucleotide monophosphatase NagD (HAD superfamily)